MARKAAFIGIRPGELLVLHDDNRLSIDEDYRMEEGTKIEGNRPISLRPFTKKDIDGLIYCLQQIKSLM